MANELNSKTTFISFEKSQENLFIASKAFTIKTVFTRKVHVKGGYSIT